MSRIEKELVTLNHVLESGWITDWSTAVDGGANIGEWSKVMATKFNRVYAFEPVPETVMFFRQNVWQTLTNVRLHEQALMDRNQRVTMQMSGKRTSLRSRFVLPDPDGMIEAIALDSLSLPSCGLLKLDLEGAEHLALIGAQETIKRCSPVLIVELRHFGERYGGNDQTTAAFIEGLGYHEVYSLGVDHVYVRQA